MSIHQAAQGEVVDVRPLKQQIASTKTSTLLKTDSTELLRLVMPAGNTIAEHKAPGEMTVHCLEGRIVFSSAENAQELVAGELLFLSAGEPHAVDAIEDSSVLVTILFRKDSQP